ncbi:uncharacterized protein I206_105693 [Kwoniella pini CBS 10737]|uniref:Uncharacterized protein n=1 Tax=Kwoniella pini CBS 10737 TaxID=1296096 RepID=A0A1B9I3I2_9TREE|nr:uncharacterized protein I206_03404 [Kwoniella pini CBS 10737]OCF50087.1 hypothetical protein I206_03404 [Kwoniella pini CBS 10737]
MGSDFVDKHYYINEKTGSTPFQRTWKKTSPIEKLLYIIYLIPLIALLIILGLIMILPFLFIRRTRPLLPKSEEIDPIYKKKKRGPGLHRRIWEMFEIFLNLYYMTLKQGLQVGGCLSSIILIYMQIRMIIHDLNNPIIIDYSQQAQISNSDPADRLRTDHDCAYGVGTGIANWANGKEPLAWYGMYHAFIIILCICLFGDELLNVRFGCFAPQWNRAGVGYTTMFLAVATLSTSPNWDFPETVQFRYIILILIFLLGLYNVLRTIVSMNGCTKSEIRFEDGRVGRKPLRFWTKGQWKSEWFRLNFLPPPGKGSYFWTENLQNYIGDWNFPLRIRSRKSLEKQIELQQNEIENKFDDGRIQKVYQKSEKELIWQRGRISRVVIHGGPRKMPPNLKAEIDAMKRIHVGQLPDYDGLLSDEEIEKIEEKVLAELEKDKGYFGIANWVPSVRVYAWLWFDVRRIFCIICGIGLLSIRAAICSFDLSAGAWYAYLDEYTKAQDNWKINGGPDDNTCQYYKGTSVPIFVLPGGKAVTGVAAMYIWVSLWNMFLVGMCLGVIGVAISNNMWWGMHLGLLGPIPVPITLIGPRMTSMSMGLTLGFVAIATLQQGFFFHNDFGIIATKIFCYAGVVGMILSLFPNEPLRPDFTRSPFWPWTSRYAFRRMDRKKWKYGWANNNDMYT